MALSNFRVASHRFASYTIGLVLFALPAGTAGELSAAANAPPQVSISALPGLVLTAPAAIALAAVATDTDGSIKRVRFYRGTTLLGTDLTAPYAFSWKALVAGDYTFTATAEDSSGAVVTSSPITVKVVSSSNAVVSIAATDAAAAESGGNTATFTVTRSAAAYTSALAVSLQRGGTASSGADYTALPGTVTIPAGATSATVTVVPINDAAAESSETVVLTAAAGTGYTVGTPASATATIADDDATANAAPIVSLTSPSNGASFTAPATVNLAATASDADGTIAKVEFLQGATVLSTDTSSPYSFAWSSVSSGSHTITARATDNRGATATSSRSITVAPAALPSLHFYVSPAGSASGDGSLSRPWDLKTGLNAPAAVQPGATLWLRGGTYRGSFISYLKGTASAPIVVRQYPGERAILDGAGSTEAVLNVRGYWAWYWGFEVMNSDPRRVSTQSGSSPTDVTRNDGILLYGSNVKLINLIVHDAADGIGFWQQAENSEVYGCVIFNNGWLGTDRGHGHGIYAQNSAGTKRITEVISLNNFATGMKAYATNTYASGFDFAGVVAFNNGAPTERGKLYRQPNLFVGTTTNPSDRITISDTHLYHVAGIEPDLGGNLVLGYLAKNNGAVTVADSRVIGGSMALKMVEWQRATLSRNTLYATSSTVNTSKQRLVDLALPAGGSTNAYSWSANEYFDATAVQSSGQRLPFVFNAGAKLTFAQWKQSSGLDASSSYHAGAPQGAEVFVQPNRYEAGRAHVIVYNWDRLTSMDVDLSTALSIGAKYEVRNAQDFLGAPIASGTYDGTRVRLPLSGLRVATPVGYDFTPASTAPEFAVFVVVPR